MAAVQLNIAADAARFVARRFRALFDGEAARRAAKIWETGGAAECLCRWADTWTNPKRTI